MLLCQRVCMWHVLPDLNLYPLVSLLTLFLWQRLLYILYHLVFCLPLSPHVSLPLVHAEERSSGLLSEQMKGSSCFHTLLPFVGLLLHSSLVNRLFCHGGVVGAVASHWDGPGFESTGCLVGVLHVPAVFAWVSSLFFKRHAGQLNWW